MGVSQWIETTIGEQVTLQRGFDITRVEQNLGDVPVVSSSGIHSYHDTAAVKGPGVILGRKGVVGSVYYVASDYWPHDTTLWVKDFHGNNQRFVYYFFKAFTPQLASMDVGSANPTLNRNHVHPLSIYWPPLPEQRAIAHILGALDDKIELNRRMNQTLEAIARALFKSWFVDFDPVRVKAKELTQKTLKAQEALTFAPFASLAPSALNPAIADLFPDALVDSELGKIPKGWRAEPVGNIVRAVGGGTPSTKNNEYWDGGIHYFATPKDMSALSAPILLETERKVTDAGLSKISSGLLPIGTVLLSSRAPVGYLALAQVPVCVNQGFIAMICDGPVSNYYMLNWTFENMDIIKGRASGTTFAEISKQNFRPILALVPPKAIITAYDELVAPLYAKIMLTLQESRTLAALRDTLLPKLISGELRVPEVSM